MSLLIDMNMPEGCWDCPLIVETIFGEKKCMPLNMQVNVNLDTGYDDNCPIKEVQDVCSYKRR